MAGVLPRCCKVLLLGALILAGGLVPGTASSESTVAVMVLCPGELPDGIPGCEAVAEALDAEIEEFSMFAVPGPTPVDTPPQEVAGPGVPFVVWTTAFAESLTLHVYEAENAVEVSKTLDLSTMDEVPSAYDLAILYRDIMGTSLYAGLAELEDDDLLDLAIPEEKEAVVLERAAANKGKAAIPMDLKMWFPQFSMGWILVAYPGQDNSGIGKTDIYNGLALSLRLPFKEHFWAGATVSLLQTLSYDFQNDIPPESRPQGITKAGFDSDQVILAAEVGWYPLQMSRFSLWVGGGPGITRTSTRLILNFDDNTTGGGDRGKTIRLSLGAATGIQLLIAPRVMLETGLRLSWVRSVKGFDRFFMDWRTEDEYGTWDNSYLYFQNKDFQISFWLTMVLG